MVSVFNVISLRLHPHVGLGNLYSMKKLTVFLVIAISVLFFAEDKKQIAWTTGTLLDVSSERGQRVIDGDSFRDDVSYYTVDDGRKYIYVLKRTLRHRRDKELTVTVNAPIKFAIVGDDFFLMDDKGETHRLSLQKRSLKTAK